MDPHITIGDPLRGRGRGRPKQNKRELSKFERVAPKTKRPRCSRCQKPGHNARTCKGKTERDTASTVMVSTTKRLPVRKADSFTHQTLPILPLPSIPKKEFVAFKCSKMSCFWDCTLVALYLCDQQHKMPPAPNGVYRARVRAAIQHLSRAVSSGSVPDSGLRDALWKYWNKEFHMQTPVGTAGDPADILRPLISQNEHMERWIGLFPVRKSACANCTFAPEDPLLNRLGNGILSANIFEMFAERPGPITLQQCIQQCEEGWNTGDCVLCATGDEEKERLYNTMETTLQWPTQENMPGVVVIHMLPPHPTLGRKWLWDISHPESELIIINGVRYLLQCVIVWLPLAGIGHYVVWGRSSHDSRVFYYDGLLSPKAVRYTKGWPSIELLYSDGGYPAYSFHTRVTK